MNGYAMLAIAPHIGKFSGLTNSHRIFKPYPQTIFDAVDKITPVFKAIGSFQDHYAAIMPPAIMARGV